MAYVDPTKRKKGFNPTGWVSDSIKQEEEDIKLGKGSGQTATKTDNKDDEDKKKQEEIKRKAKSKLAYNSLFERIGDVFEANSPQDKAKRVAAGQPELYQDQKKQYNDVTNRAKTANYSKDEIKARQDFFKTYGVNDLEKAATTSRKYDAAFNKDAPKGTDYKKLADQAIKEGLFNDTAKATYEAAGRLKNPKVQQGLYRQAIREAMPDYNTKQIGKAEQAYQDKLKLESGSEGSIIKTAIRGFSRGLTSTIAELPSNAESLASQIVDIASPDKSRVGKFADARYKEAARKNAEVKTKEDAAFGQGKTDNSIVYNLGQGFGSLSSSVALGNILGQVDKVGEATSFLGKVKAFANPFGVGGLFGVNEAGEISREAKDKGAGDARSLATGLGSGYAQAVLENWGLGKFLGAEGGLAKQFLKQGVIEGSQEFMQAVSSYGFQQTYKDVDWSSAMADALQQGIYGAAVGSVGSIPMTMSNNLQKQGVPQDQADAIGMKLDEEIKRKVVENIENNQPAQGEVTNQPETGTAVTPTGSVTDMPVGTEPQILSHITKASNLDSILKEGLKPATPMQLDEKGQPTDKPLPGYEGQQAVYFERGNKNTYKHEGEDNIKIIMEDSKLPNKVVNGDEIAVNENVIPTPDNVFMIEVPNQELADKLEALGYAVSINPDLAATTTEKPKEKYNPPEVESTEAQNDWEDNYAQKYQDLNDQTTALQEQLKTAKKAERNGIQKQIDVISKQQADMEEEFVKKWKNQPGQTDEGVRPKGKVKPLKPKKANQPEGKYPATLEGVAKPLEGYKRYKVNVAGVDIYADYNPSYIDDQTAHIEFRTNGANPISETGYKSHFPMSTAVGTTDEEIQKELQSLADQMYKESPAKPPKASEEKPKAKKGAVKKIEKKADFGQFKVGDSVSFHKLENGKVVGLEDKVYTIKSLLDSGGGKIQLVDDKNNEIWTTKDGIEKAKATANPPVKKGEVKKIEKKSKADVKLTYPEDTKELPKYMQENMPQNTKEFEKTGKQKDKKITELSPTELTHLLMHDIGWRKSDLQKLIRLVPGLKQNPILKIEESTGKDRYGSPIKGLYMTYDFDGHTGKIPIDSVGLSQERLEASGIKDGMTIDISAALRGKGKLPVINKGGQNFMEDTGRSAHQIDSKTSRNVGEITSIDDIVKTIKDKYGITNHDRTDINRLEKIIGNPEADVTIYRASKSGKLENGRWVTTSRTYAYDIQRQNGGKVYTYTVKAKDLNLPGNIEDNPSLARFAAFQYQKAKESNADMFTSRAENNALTAKTPEQLAQMAIQLNKAGQSLAILRRAGLKSKKALGMFVHPNGKSTNGHIGLQDKVVSEAVQYVDVLAHELWHAIEYQVNGSTGKTYKVFGDLTKEETKQIHEELKAITMELEGEEVVNAKPDYFNKKTELMARYVEMMVLNPELALEKAPLVSEKFKQAVVNHPEIQMLMDAIDGKLDEGWRDWAFSWYRDMRQTYQHVLGKQAGDLAYNAEVVQRAKKQAWEKQVGELIKEKFKNVKDDQSLLFRAAESIKSTDSEGNITFGTNDYTVTDKEDEVEKLLKSGWVYVGTTEQDGKVQGLFQKTRYTAEQAKAIYDELSPEGKQLIKDYTANAQDAKDFFNRNLLKEMFKVNGNIEGWVHRGLQDPKKVKQQKGRMSLGKGNLRHLTAGMMKKRSGSDTYLEDLQKQTAKALYEAGMAEIHNQYIAKQLARISKPIAKGQDPDNGWVEITADEVKGLMLPGEGGRDKVMVDYFDEMTGEEVKYSFLKPQNRYQVPAKLVKYYRNIRQVHEELSQTQKFLDTFAQYWAVNVLVQGGTVGTNFVSGALQYSSKIVNDFFLDTLYGDVTMKRTRDNIAAMVQVLLPHGWTDAPAYVYGGHRSNFAGQFITESRSKKAISTYANYALMPFSGVESYWKKAIITSEGSHNFKPHFSPKEMVVFTEAEEEMLTLMNSQADRYGFDYGNVPMWIESWQRGGGTLIKPFVKYPYKYAKFITNHVSRATDSTLSWQERTASLLTLATLVAMFWGLMDWRDRAKDVPDDIEASAYNTKGRVFIGKIGGKDVFTRVSKYPFLNLTAAMRNAARGNWDESWNVMREQVGSLGPVATPILIALGYSDQFNTYTPKPAMFGKAFVSAMPGFRLLNDIGNFMDNTPRKAETFVQGVFQSLPVWGSEQLKETLRGKPRTIKVPNEDEERQLGKSSTDTKAIEMYREATLLSALTGIYTTRIDPEDAKKQKLREKRIDVEDKIYQLIREDKIDEAEQLAIDNGLWFTSKQVKSTQRAAKKRAEEEEQ